MHSLQESSILRNYAKYAGRIILSAAVKMPLQIVCIKLLNDFKVRNEKDCDIDRWW
jgi:hypothetical protein